ncbi:hypothetical protein [Kitasatospora griseola]|uniref:hypothetical protein n=1 Tax=Kitasatospora griseola TaxID=2064 RepID=UPI0034369D1D
MSIEESAIRPSWRAAAQAHETKDLDLLMSFHTPDVGYDDAVAPLRFVGTEEGAAQLRTVVRRVRRSDQSADP